MRGELGPKALLDPCEASFSDSVEELFVVIFQGADGLEIAGCDGLSHARARAGVE